MKICNFSIRHINDFNPINIEMDKNVIIFSSKKNGTGKTTLMRAILYTLGFPIPSTELVNFTNYEFKLKILKNNKIINITRSNQLLNINENEYDLPIDQNGAHIFLFGSSNSEIINNILGTIYFDQEKGWTLLNRGIIIGENRFQIESFFRGLKGDESDDSYRIVAKINIINKKIEQYKLMSNVSEYHESVERDVERNVTFSTYVQTIDEKLLAKKIQLQNIENEINTITEIIKKNKTFSDYISAKKVYVKNPIDDSPIRVTKNTLFNYNDTEEINIARKGRLVAERNKLKNEIFEQEQKQKLEQEESLFDLPNLDEELTRQFSTTNIFPSMQVKIMLDKFVKERDELKKELKNRTKQDNSYLENAYNIINNYAKELKIPSGYKIDILTSNLKGKSGAILHKMVFIYKLAYIKLLSKKLGYLLPIFLDSPSGREVEKNTIEEMLNIIKRDFASHQIIIASINNYKDIFPNEKSITMNGTLFDIQGLFGPQNIQ